MGIFTKYAAHDVGTQGEKSDLFSRNHFASTLTPQVQAQITAMMLHRVAGNVYECPSSKDFWQVKNGQIIKLTGDEVDNGESIPAAPKDNPMGFISTILSDLDF